MSDERRLPSEDYVECARRLRQLHALIRSGDGDSDRAEALRDEMDDPWIRMSQEERDWTGDLSADLHVLGGDRPLFADRPTNGPIRQRLLDASRRDDCAGLRSLLASDAESTDLFDRLLFRAIYWAALKDYESSLEFLESLARHLDEDRSEIETRQTSLARIEKASTDVTVVEKFDQLERLGQLALGRIAHVSEEIHRLIVIIRSMGSSAVAPGSSSTAWDVVKEKFFLAEEQLRACSELAA